MARTFPFPGLGTLTAQYAGVEQDIYAKGSPEPLDAYVAGYGLQNRKLHTRSRPFKRRVKLPYNPG